MELLLRLFAVLQNFLCIILEPVYWIFTKMETTVPMQPIRNPILTLSAAQLAAKIRTGELSCEDVINSYIFRSKRVNAKLNAIVGNRYVSALEEAEKVDQLIASETKSLKELEEEMPLLGVPFSVKECCKLKGMSFSLGCKFGAGNVADSDGVAVGLLRKAGAIPIAVTNQPELGLSTETNNPMCGLTRNPYNTHRTVGGSSGGEAALISSAGSVVGVGSDLFGCIRCPAMFTGIFGHRPTPRSVSIQGHYPGGDSNDLADHLVVGPLTRYAEDLPLMMRVMAGNKATQLDLSQQVNLKDLKIYYITEAGYSMGLPPVNKEIKLAIMKAVDYLGKTCSCDVQRVDFTEMSDAQEISRAVLFKDRNLSNIFYETDSTNPKEHPNVFLEMLKRFIGLPVFSLSAHLYNLIKTAKSFIPIGRTISYTRQNEILKKKITKTLGEDGVLICPTYPTSAHYHYQSRIRMFGVMYCTIITSLGFPATNVPMGLNKNGLPIGLQVVASPYQDRLCFAVAKELEEAFGGWRHPPCLQTPTDEKKD